MNKLNRNDLPTDHSPGQRIGLFHRVYATSQFDEQLDAVYMHGADSSIPFTKLYRVSKEDTT